MTGRKLYEATAYNCPRCGGKLSFDIEEGSLACQYCQVVFKDDEMPEVTVDKNKKVRESDPNALHVENTSEFLSRTTWGRKLEDLHDVTSYTCSACGAVISTTQTMASLSCPYCGNNMFVTDSDKPLEFPQKIVPFTVEEEQAKQIFSDYLKDKPYLKKTFDPQLEHIAAVYVPYRVYSFDIEKTVSEAASYEGMSIDEPGKVCYYCYCIGQNMKTHIDNIKIDTASKMPDAYMDSISPFNLDKAPDFKLGYATGLLLEMPDETSKRCRYRAERLARSSFYERSKNISFPGKYILPNFPEEHGEPDNLHSRDKTTVTLKEETTFALPVWLLHFTYANEDLLFAINGVTGKCVGNLPTDEKRKRATLAKTVLKSLGLSVIMWFLTYSLLLFVGEIVTFLASLVWLVIYAVIFVRVGVWLKDLDAQGEMNTVRKAKNTDVVGDEWKIITKEWGKEDIAWTSEEAAQTVEALFQIKA